MIQVDNLTKFFGPVMAVDHISFDVGQGEIVGFLGPNGAGKTTTMRILTSYLPATSGIVRVAGHDVMTQSLEVRQNIGYLPDTVPLYPEMRVEEYLTYRAKLKGVDRKERPKRLEYVLEHFRVREVRRRLIGTLSHGYRQRVGLADALIHDPPLLILDEPTGGLDPVQIRETLKTIRNLKGKHTILLSTHILSQVEDACDRVIIINRGKIGLDKKLDELAKERGTFLVEVRGPKDQVSHVLETTDGVENVKAEVVADGITSYEVHPKTDDDLREALFSRIAKNGWTIRRLEQVRRRLEFHFVNLVVHEQSAAFRNTEKEAPAESSTAVQAAKNGA
ncbi:MAG: ATP-binding cassette domain-containing protein [Planctomycetia bacterium]|nr:ATP-binding cassette domain-containing protein [Planctomycetia bacterium]